MVTKTHEQRFATCIHTWVARGLQRQRFLYKQMKYITRAVLATVIALIVFADPFQNGSLFCAEFHEGENNTSKSKHFIKTTNHLESGEILQPGIIKLQRLPLLC